ncbi:unnamed protein product [Pichia kudriavzevii]
MFRIRGGIRYLSTTTTLNPTSIRFHRPDNHHKSLILLTTPSQLNQIVTKLSESTQPKVESLLVASVDSITGSRNAFTELWLETPFKIKELELVEDMEKRLSKKYNPLSADPIKMQGRNWKDTTEETILGLSIPQWNVTFHTRLANTIFTNSQQSTCFIANGGELDYLNLSQVRIDIDTDQEHGSGNITYHNRLTEIPMVCGIEDTYKITDFKGNLIKSINHKSASGYLTENPKVMDSKKDLFFKLYSEGDNVDSWMEEYYRLVVGGLGWGEKQAFIALDTVVGEPGLRNVRLFYHDEQKPKFQLQSPDNKDSMVFECTELEEGYQDFTKDNDEKVLPRVFGVGSNHGFNLNGVWHRSNGETVVL